MRYSRAERESYGMGLRCAQAGAPDTACPYSLDSGLGRSWLAGYGIGKKISRTRHQPDATDMAYEDQCAAMCGL